MKIAICIPTYNRPDLLSEALLSCLDQTILPGEILIGDDSFDNKTQKLVTQLELTSLVKIRYFHNYPSLGQAINVNFLFKNVKEELTMLLHDDDTLLPDALENLFKCFTEHPGIDVAFGKNYIMSNNRVIDKKKSEQLNKDYYRSLDYEGIKLSSLEAGFLQQFPNNGYVIRTELTKRIQYKEEFADACDFDFGLRVGITRCKIYFLNKYTINYRLTKESVSKKPNNNAGLNSYELVAKLKVPSESFPYKAQWLKKKAPIAIAEAVNLKQSKKALSIYFSKWHRKKICTPGGVKRFFTILLSYIISISFNHPTEK